MPAGSGPVVTISLPVALMGVLVPGGVYISPPRTASWPEAKPLRYWAFRFLTRVLRLTARGVLPKGADSDSRVPLEFDRMAVLVSLLALPRMNGAPLAAAAPPAPPSTRARARVMICA